MTEWVAQCDRADEWMTLYLSHLLPNTYVMRHGKDSTVWDRGKTNKTFEHISRLSRFGKGRWVVPVWVGSGPPAAATPTQAAALWKEAVKALQGRGMGG